MTHICLILMRNRKDSHHYATTRASWSAVQSYYLAYSSALCHEDALFASTRYITTSCRNIFLEVAESFIVRSTLETDVTEEAARDRETQARLFLYGILKIYFSKRRFLYLWWWLVTIVWLFWFFLDDSLLLMKMRAIGVVLGYMLLQVGVVLKINFEEKNCFFNFILIN